MVQKGFFEAGGRLLRVPDLGEITAFLPQHLTTGHCLKLEEEEEERGGGEERRKKRWEEEEGREAGGWRRMEEEEVEEGGLKG